MKDTDSDSHSNTYNNNRYSIDGHRLTFLLADPVVATDFSIKCMTEGASPSSRIEKLMVEELRE